MFGFENLRAVQVYGNVPLTCAMHTSKSLNTCMLIPDMQEIVLPLNSQARQVNSVARPWVLGIFSYLIIFQIPY